MDSVRKQSFTGKDVFLIYSRIPFIYIKKKENNPGLHTVFQKQQEMTEIKEMTEKLKKSLICQGKNTNMYTYKQTVCFIVNFLLSVKSS